MTRHRLAVAKTTADGGRLINVGCRWNAGKNRAPAPPGRVYAPRAPIFEKSAAFCGLSCRLDTPAPWKKKGKKGDGTSWKSAATFRLRKCKSRNATDYAHGFGPSKTRRRGGKGKEKKEGWRGGEEKRRKRKRKQKRWFASGPWLPRTPRNTGGVEGGEGRGKLNVRKKVANVVKIRDRQSGALCPAGEQYRRRSGDWRIFLRIGRHCWIFQIVFLACAAVEIARNPFGHCHLSISLLPVLRFIAV